MWSSIGILYQAQGQQVAAASDMTDTIENKLMNLFDVFHWQLSINIGNC